MRYEYAAPLTETGNRLPNFDTTSGTLVPVPSNGLQWHDPRPEQLRAAARLRVAAVGNAKTVFRGGFGVFYSEPMTYMGWSAGATLRQSITVTSNPTTPNITLANAFPLELRVESRNVTVINRDRRHQTRS